MKRSLLVLALLFAGAASAQQYTVETLRDNGPSANRIDIVVLGDGYTSADQDKFITDATTMTNALFAATPWKEYAGLFNVRAVHVISNETGGDQGTYGTSRDTALGGYYYCSPGVQRLLCVDDSRVYGIAMQATPDYDLLIVIVNDPLYGGSGGPIAVASTNVNSNEILIHELGHTLGHLADEYESPYPGYPDCNGDCTEANATLNATSTVKWKAWIPAGEPIPTPETSAYASPIGVFEGCRYKSTGVYRPKLTACRMNLLGVPYCSVCTEAMVKAFWNRVSMFDDKSPAPTSSQQQCSPMTFSVTQPSLLTPTYRYSWTVNDAPQTASTSGLTATPTVNSVIQLKVQDSTALVRTDPQLVLEDTTSWTVSVTGASCTRGDCDEEILCLDDGGCAVTPKSSGGACGATSCSNGVVTSAGSCDGAGTCSGGGVATPCTPYQCNNTGNACLKTCATSTDCQSDFVCASGECVPYVDAGTPDAGTPDAGAPDAGSDVDAGSHRTILLPAVPSEGPAFKSGCGCGAADGTGLLALLAIGAALSRRSRRA
ncbi:MAG: M64 family metallopeptidase [Myxococcaceae bacterium]